MDVDRGGENLGAERDGAGEPGDVEGAEVGAADDAGEMPERVTDIAVLGFQALDQALDDESAGGLEESCIDVGGALP